MAQQPSSITETYGNWTVQCQSSEASGDEDAQRVCQASQELRQSEIGQRIILVALTNPEDATKGVQVTIVAPFGLSLPAGIQLKINEVELTVVRFSTCIEGTGCIANADLSSEHLNKLGKEQMLGVTMVAANGQKIQTNMSLDGFRASYDRLQSLR